MHSRALRILTTTTAALTAATLLTACAGTDTETDPAADTHQETQAETLGDADANPTTETPQFDTGAYKSEPLPGWTETSDQDGPTTEMTNIANNTVLPYEVDEDFAENVRIEYYDHVGKFAFDFPEPTLDRLHGIESQFLMGYGVSAEAQDGRLVSNIVMRFVDPEGAQAGVDALTESFLTEGPQKFFESDPEEPGYLVDIPQHPEAQAVRSANGEVLHVMETHNEYLMHSIVSLSDEIPGDYTQEQLDWQVGYGADFFDKQKPLLDLIPTKKTEAGYGFSDKWPAVDPDDILRYTLASPTDDSVPRTFSFTSPMNSRQMAGNYSSAPQMLTVLEQAGVEAMAQNQTRLFRAKNPESADLLAATLRALRSDGEIEYWDDEQNVPGVKCTTTYVSTSTTTHTCDLVYENYFATASIEDTDFSQGDERVGEAPEDTPPVDPKKQLSQAMAAQYLILQNAPTKN